MSSISKIEWTDATWNPVLGCSKISSGCKNCYAETFSERFRGVKGHPFEKGFDLRLVPEKLTDPLGWKKPRLIFTCSMSDLFHENIPDDYISSVFKIMNKANWHTFQILTKRSKRLLELSPDLLWSRNIWMGVSVENQENLTRVRDLSNVPAIVRFISLEPLLGPVENLPLSKIDWVIVGGESGHKARPMDLNWVRSIRDQCQSEKVPFFLKQLGGKQSKRGGNEAKIDGKLWHQLPANASVYSN